jgi:uracil-DNA glycosylase family 4
MSIDLDKIINDAETYIRNFSRFYSGRVYIEKKGNNIQYSQSKDDTLIVSDSIKHENNDEKHFHAETKVVVDLFGNVIQQKEDWEFSETLDELYSKICDCVKCPLGYTRTKFVFGVGSPHADIVMIGEAPGADEDRQGEPFVGRAGQLLNKILDATGFKREEVYICNILKCRPPGNRSPLSEEIDKCEPYLKYQLNLIKPKLILALGKVAAETLLKKKEALNKMRGKIHYYNGIKMMVTFHPAALLRNPQWKRPTWEDMQQFKKIYDELKNK